MKWFRSGGKWSTEDEGRNSPARISSGTASTSTSSKGTAGSVRSEAVCEEISKGVVYGMMN